MKDTELSKREQPATGKKGSRKEKTQNMGENDRKHRKGEIRFK
jgi:hypothetical protein